MSSSRWQPYASAPHIDASPLRSVRPHYHLMWPARVSTIDLSDGGIVSGGLRYVMC